MRWPWRPHRDRDVAEWAPGPIGRLADGLPERIQAPEEWLRVDSRCIRCTNRVVHVVDDPGPDRVSETLLLGRRPSFVLRERAYRRNALTTGCVQLLLICHLRPPPASLFTW